MLAIFWTGRNSVLCRKFMRKRGFLSACCRRLWLSSRPISARSGVDWWNRCPGREGNLLFPIAGLYFQLCPYSSLFALLETAPYSMKHCVIFCVRLVLAHLPAKNHMFGRGRGREGEEVLTLAEPTEDEKYQDCGQIERV